MDIEDENNNYENTLFQAFIIFISHKISKLLFLFIIAFIISEISKNGESIKNNKIYSSKINDIIQGDLIPFKDYYLSLYTNQTMYDNNIKDKYFNLTEVKYVFSIIYNKIKLEYNIGIYDKNKNLIHPSDLALYNNFHIVCTSVINNITIYSYPNIYEDKYFNCIEYLFTTEQINFGLTFFNNLDKNNSFIYNFYFESDNLFDLNDIRYKNDSIFDPIEMQKIYYNFINETYNQNITTLKKSYTREGSPELKRKIFEDKNGWIFENIYNNYFCFCIGEKCLQMENNQLCKFYLYEYIIEKNKDIYPKTEYLFADFLFKDLSSDDTYPIFETMISKNFPVHYITEKPEIYEKYCSNIENCEIIIPINRTMHINFGDFLENHLTFFLKIKAVISGRESNYYPLSKLLKRADYITYVCIGHGVCYFKDYLYEDNRVYGIKRNDKILIPPVKTIINKAKKYGWEDENIIKLNLPRWDRYNITYNDANKKLFEINKNITNNSILVMFTWREAKNKTIKKKEEAVSPLYHDNILKILQDKHLNKKLEKKNITLYFSFHRLLNQKYKTKYDEVINKYNKIVFIEQNEISDCLSKVNLVLSDFSSIIFDMIARNKPFVIFVPDEKDAQISNIYSDVYINLIKEMKNDKIKFKNIFHNTKETINKILYYIKNDFKLEDGMKKFYKKFGFKYGNNTNEFVDYLINMK